MKTNRLMSQKIEIKYHLSIIRRSTRERIEFTRLVRYARFPDQIVDADGDFINKVMMTANQNQMIWIKP